VRTGHPRVHGERGALAASPKLRGNRLTVECILDVVQGTRLSRTAASPETVESPPPPDLREHLGALLRAQVGAHVAFIPLFLLPFRLK